MDCFVGMKKSKKYEKGLKELTQKIWPLEEEIKAIMYEREKESKAYERDMMVYGFKEAEWKQERKRLKEEVKKLRKMVEEKEVRIKGIEDGLAGEKSDDKEGQFLATTTTSFLVEQMREESLRRDEAVDKWKKLYLAIKMELDDLIQSTTRDGLYWRAEEEEIIEELKMEVKAKDITIEELKARLTLAEREEYKRTREVDILRQSLRIMSDGNQPSNFALSKPKSALVKKATKA